jgi:alcohol dehydrogenase (cytochrome c)
MSRCALVRGVSVIGVIALCPLVASGYASSHMRAAVSGHRKAAAASPIVASTWSRPNANIYNTRAVTSKIDASNVSQLRQAWTLPITAKLTPTQVPIATSEYAANTPIFGPNGTVYFQDIDYSVYAINSTTGKLEWKRPYGLASEGPNGVTLVDGVIYGTTPTFAFALQASTGKQLWRSRQLIPTVAQAEASLKLAPPWKDSNLAGVKPNGQGLNDPPQVANGKVFVSTSGDATGGHAYALNAKTGKVLWSFVETKVPSTRGLGGSLGTGGSWGAPAVAPNGTVYLGTGNGYQAATSAIKHPAQLLYDDSTVALDPNTGAVKWYYQATPDDFYDWDMQISPIYVPSGVHGEPTVLDGSKDGQVYAMNANTGRLFWKAPVGKHNGHDNDGQLALEGKFHPKFPYIVWPGDLGGIETNMAYANGVVYAGFVNAPQQITNGPFDSGTAPTVKTSGGMAAIDVATGKKLWQTALPSFALGAATVTNNLVFTAEISGKVVAFNRSTGKIVWTGQLPGKTNSQLAIYGNTLVTAASIPTGNNKPKIVAFTLGKS